jgi:hypothetical protein
MALGEQGQGGALMMRFRAILDGLNPFLAAMRWLEDSAKRHLQRSLVDAAEPTFRKMKAQLWEGGLPKFAPLSPFSIAIRRAVGIEGQRPGKGSYTLAKLITIRSVERGELFVGVPNDAPYPGKRNLKAAKVAEWLEYGRGAVVLPLDRPSSATGKTPRQWLMWLYLQGALSAPPSKRKTHVILKAAPARPFVYNTWLTEQNELPPRVAELWEKRFDRGVPFGISRRINWIVEV